MEMLLEYFYCVLYAASMTLCIYKYLDTKPSFWKLLLFIALYGFVDFCITGKIFLDIHSMLVINIFTIISDYFMICLLNKKIKAYLLFYTIVYFTLFSMVMAIILYTLQLIEGFHVFMTLELTIIRFIVIIIFNLMSIALFRIVEKVNIMPKRDIVKNNYKIFCLVNILISFIYTILQGIDYGNVMNEYMSILSCILVFLWFVLIDALNKSFVLARYKESEILSHSIFLIIEEYIKEYEKDEKIIRKIKHDIKNHFVIIKSLDTKEEVNKYIDKVYTSLQNMKVLSKKMSGNVYIDAIISSKINEYPNVKIKYNLNTQNMDMDSVDLCVLLFNLVDNACMAANEVAGKVSIEMIYDSQNLNIELKNECKGKTNFISKRWTGHGYGLKIVNEVVKKYDGAIEFEALQNLVVIKVGLTL